MSDGNPSRLTHESAADPRDADTVPAVSANPPLAGILSKNQKRRERKLLVHARYREKLSHLGLTRAEHFLSLPGLIVSGHVDRNVSRVLLGGGPNGLPAYLKREHCRPWKELFVNLLTGFGWVSRSRREALMLQEARSAGVAVPDWLAAGEDEQGRAFLLIRALTGVLDLREYLLEFTGSVRERRSFGRRLGAELARMHDHGFEHRDLYANHVLVDGEGRLQIIDWQRARRGRLPLGWSRRVRELACLDATLTNAAASRSDRLGCLRAYLAETHLPVARWQLARTIRMIARASRWLLKKRHVREIRHACPAAAQAGPQDLVWLDGEACCVTPGFLARLAGKLPDWLKPLLSQGTHPRLHVAAPGTRALALTRRSASSPWRWLLGLLRRRPLRSPELQQSVLLFRLERLGIAAPRLLAFGQKSTRPWATESFLLSETDAEAVELLEWLHSQPAGSARRRLVAELGRFLRRLHDADCVLDLSKKIDCLAVSPFMTGGPLPLLNGAAGLCKQWPTARRVRRDLAAVIDILSAAGCPRTDAYRFLLGYFTHRALAPSDRRLAALLRAGRC